MTGGEIALEEGEGRGRFHLPVAGGEAELLFVLRADGAMRIDRTYVPPAARGGDVAMRLVRAAVAKAGREGRRIDPQCSYVARVFDFMPEWAALRA